MTTTETGHRHSFPVNDGTGTILNPGVCGCGKTYDQAAADRALTEALEAVAAAYGVPPRISTHWAVAWGSENLNDGSGYVEPRDDEDDARELAPYYEDGRVVKRTVIALRWEAVPDETRQPEERGRD
jgi:hypothetical protein